MIKKYTLLITAILVILMFTSTSTASFLFSEGIFYERLPENSPLKPILDRLYQVAYNNDDDVALDADGEDDETDDEDDGEEDDGEYDDEIDPDDGPEEDVLLPKIWNMVGEKTPDDGNELVDDSEETTTIDSDCEVGATQDEWTVDLDGDGGAASNEITTSDYIAEGEWTVEAGTTTVKLERFVKIVTELNGNLGAFLQRVIERTVATDENGISSPGSGGSAENNIVDVVVEGESVGNPGEDIADVIVLTDGGQ